jgi:hypothetical protein
MECHFCALTLRTATVRVFRTARTAVTARPNNRRYQ